MNQDAIAQLSCLYCAEYDNVKYTKLQKCKWIEQRQLSSCHHTHGNILECIINHKIRKRKSRNLLMQQQRKWWKFAFIRLQCWQLRDIPHKIYESQNTFFILVKFGQKYWNWMGTCLKRDSHTTLFILLYWFINLTFIYLILVKDWVIFNDFRTWQKRKYSTVSKNKSK